MKKWLFTLIISCLCSHSMAQTVIAEADTLRKGRLLAVAATEAVLYTSTMAYLQFVWYKDVKKTPFEFYDDTKGYLQMDKFGHAYTSYLESYAGYKAMRWAGLPKKKALLYGGTLGFILQSPIEIWDGFYEGWGFSWGDIAANAAGSGLMIGQEWLFDEQKVKMKMSFSPSPYAKQANGYLGKTAFNQFFMEDYNAQTYWFSFGLSRISSKIPPWVNLSLGYSANGMFGEFENIKKWGQVVIPPTERYRQFLLSLDIDWTKIKTKNKFLNKVFQGMFMIKLPLPALEINTKGQFRAYGVYY